MLSAEVLGDTRRDDADKVAPEARGANHNGDRRNPIVHVLLLVERMLDSRHWLPQLGVTGGESRHHS